METSENFHKFIFRGIKIIYLILSTFPSNLCVQDRILKVILKDINENLPLRLESSFACYWTAKMVLKITNSFFFSSCLVMITVSNDFSYLEGSLFISGIFGNHGNFHKLISWGTKTIYLILSTFLGILCVQGTILKLMLKVINEHLLLLLENGFSGY